MLLSSTVAFVRKILYLLCRRCFQAIPCISTGIYGYPNEQAAHVALLQTRNFLEQNKSKVDRVIFTTYLDKDKLIYEELMQRYFPVSEKQESKV